MTTLPAVTCLRGVTPRERRWGGVAKSGSAVTGACMTGALRWTSQTMRTWSTIQKRPEVSNFGYCGDGTKWRRYMEIRRRDFVNGCAAASALLLAGIDSAAKGKNASNVPAS